MIIFFKKSKIHEIIIFLLVYSFFFILGTFIYKDYGISVDEWDQRILGFVNLKYIFEIYFQDSLINLNNIINVPDISIYSENTHGPILTLFMAFIEYYFNIDDSQKYYLFRHYANFIIFFISSIFFFLIIKKRFNSFAYGIIGTLFLFLSPRIFAESFYNNKDIIFLSLTIINLYYGIKFLNETSYLNTLLFSLTTAFSVDLRIIGILLPCIIIFLYLIKYDLFKKKLYIKYISLYLLFTPIFITLFWPFLWNDTFKNFIYVLKSFSAYDWNHYVYYLGEFIHAKNLPWHYIFVWMGLTIPLFYLIIFLIGFIINSSLIIKRFFELSNNSKNNNMWKNDIELEDFVNYTFLVAPIFLIIGLNSTIYDGWRHLYFIYPSFLILSLRGLNFIEKVYLKNNKKILIAFISIFLVNISYNMIKNHPYQNVYYNQLATKKIKQSLEKDYWALSNKQAFEFILNESKNDIIKIGAATPISLQNSLQILNLNDRKRIKITDNKNADYIIDNYRNWHGKYIKKRYKIPDNFNIYKEIIVSDIIILSIYKKI